MSCRGQKRKLHYRDPAKNEVSGIRVSFVKPIWWSAFDLQLTKVLREWELAGRLNIGKGIW